MYEYLHVYTYRHLCIGILFFYLYVSIDFIHVSRLRINVII